MRILNIAPHHDPDFETYTSYGRTVLARSAFRGHTIPNNGIFPARNSIFAAISHDLLMSHLPLSALVLIPPVFHQIVYQFVCLSV